MRWAMRRWQSSAGSCAMKAIASARSVDTHTARSPFSMPSVTSAAALIDAFCDQMWLQDGLAAASLASYRRDLTQWALWLDANESSLLAAQRADVETFLADQYRNCAKAASIARRLSSLRRFYGLQV